MSVLALDVDGVLADTHTAFLSRYNQRHGTNYQISDITYWDWPIDEFGKQQFSDLTNEEWRNYTLDINPCETNLSRKVESISQEVEVKIVTARYGCDDEIQEWLQHQGITNYTEFMGGVKKKAELGFDYYIDDNPNMIETVNENQTLFLRNRQWNASVSNANVVYIDSISDVLEHM